jgi:hypothetical protein
VTTGSDFTQQGGNGGRITSCERPPRKGDEQRVIRLRTTNIRPSAAISVQRVARLGRNVGQPDHILANPITSHEAERRPGSDEIWLALGLQLADRALEIIPTSTSARRPIFGWFRHAGANARSSAPHSG